MPSHISILIWVFWVYFSYVDARLYVDHQHYSVGNDDERPCTKHCPCLPLRDRAKSDPYVFSLATNPFYLWLICTIFTEAGEEFVPKTLTQLYTWVILVFAHRYSDAEKVCNKLLHTTLVKSKIDFCRPKVGGSFLFFATFP